MYLKTSQQSSSVHSSNMKFLFKFLTLVCGLNVAFCKLSKNMGDWAYTTKAFTFSGQECISNCEYSQCVVNFEGDMKACFETDQPAMQFYTELLGVVCISNCVYHPHYNDHFCATTIEEIVRCNPTSRQEHKCMDYCALYDDIKFMCKTASFERVSCAPPATIRESPSTTESSTTSTTFPTTTSTKPPSTNKPHSTTTIKPESCPVQPQINCDCKNTVTYDKKDIYFKIEANVPHDMVEKLKGNQYHFTINFGSTSDSKTPSEGGQTESTTESGQKSTTTKKSSTKTPPVDEQSDEIPEEMVRSNFGKTTTDDNRL